MDAKSPILPIKRFCLHADQGPGTHFDLRAILAKLISVKRFITLWVALGCFTSLLPVQAEPHSRCCCSIDSGLAHCPSSSPCQTPTTRSSTPSRLDADRSTSLPLRQTKECSANFRNSLHFTPISSHPSLCSASVGSTLPYLPTHTRLAYLCRWLT